MNGSSEIGVGQDPMADLVNTRDYTVVFNDSPEKIAKRFGIAMSTLLAANPQKPTTFFNGVKTFRDLQIGETLNIPSVGLNGTGVGFNFLKATFVPWGLPAENREGCQPSSRRSSQQGGSQQLGALAAGPPGHALLGLPEVVEPVRSGWRDHLGRRRRRRRAESR